MADFREFYQIDLRDIWRRKLSYFEAARLTKQLFQRDTRIAKLLKDVAMTQTEALLLDLVDQMNYSNYCNSLLVSAKFGNDRKAYREWVKHIPEPNQRPRNRPEVVETPEIVHVQGKDLAQALGSAINMAALKDFNAQK